MFNELLCGEPDLTLTREEAGDVALDMDLVEYITVEDFEVSSSSEDEESLDSETP